MVRGRMINASISISGKVASLSSDTARMLFAFAIAHLDRDGRVVGDPRQFKASVVPMLEHVTTPVVAQCLADMISCLLVVAYEDASGRRVLAYPEFRNEQHSSFRPEREAASKFGPPPNPIQTYSGVVPEWLRTYSGSTPTIAGTALILPNQAEPLNSGSTPELVQQLPELLRPNKGNRSKYKISPCGEDVGSPSEAPASAFTQVRDFYLSEFLRNRGEAAPFGSREGASVAKLLKALEGSPERACDAIRNAYTDPFWGPKSTINTIANEPARHIGTRDGAANSSSQNTITFFEEPPRRVAPPTLPTSLDAALGKVGR